MKIRMFHELKTMLASYLSIHFYISHHHPPLPSSGVKVIRACMYLYLDVEHSYLIFKPGIYFASHPNITSKHLKKDLNPCG